jgi:hypothetical protein
VSSHWIIFGTLDSETMARKLSYRIIDDNENRILDPEWEEIGRLQDWYNKEFPWTAGSLRFKRFVVFPNSSHRVLTEPAVVERIGEIIARLKRNGRSEAEIVDHLSGLGLIFVKRGGYFDGCLASGFTRVAGNEYNAYLVCEFLLHASRIASQSSIYVEDEGTFIQSRSVMLRDGSVLLNSGFTYEGRTGEEFIHCRHVFSVVNPEKYDGWPSFRTTIPDYAFLDVDERNRILRDWNWLGFERGDEGRGEDHNGLDLNRKVRDFILLS